MVFLPRNKGTGTAIIGESMPYIKPRVKCSECGNFYRTGRKRNKYICPDCEWEEFDMNVGLTDILKKKGVRKNA